MIRNVSVAAGICAAVALSALGAQTCDAAAVASAVTAQAAPQPVTQPKAPAQSPGRPQATPGLGDQKQIEGRIRSVGPTVQNIVIDDGTMLVLPDSLAIRRSDLSPGAVIRAQYEERDGQKVITTITVNPPSLVK